MTMKITKLIREMLKKDVSIPNQSQKMPVTQLDRNEYRRRKTEIDNLFLKYSNEFDKKLLDTIKSENEKIREYNNICPKCNSHNIINRAIETKNNVKLYNHCSDCGNEWNIKEQEKEIVDVGHLGCMVCHALDVIVMRLFSSKFDPYDVTCPYDSEKEAECAMIDSVKSEFSDILIMPIELIYHIAAKWATLYMFLTDDVFGENADYKNNSYMGSFSEKMEDILINKLGVKKIFN